jgi:hypothetical protein
VPSHIIPLAAPGVVTSALKWMLDPNSSPFGLKIRLDLKYISWLIQFAAACNEANVSRALEPMKNLGFLSADNFAKMIAEEKFDCHYQTTGFLNLYKNQAAFDEGKHEAEFMQKHGIPVSVYEKIKLQMSNLPCAMMSSAACISRGTRISTLRYFCNCSANASVRWGRRCLRIRLSRVLNQRREKFGL